MALKTLEEHNREVEEQAVKLSWEESGVACPDCDEELLRGTRSILVSTGLVAEAMACCPNCRWRGMMKVLREKDAR